MVAVKEITTTAALTQVHHKGLQRRGRVTFGHQSSATNQRLARLLSVPRIAAQEKCGALHQVCGEQARGSQRLERLGLPMSQAETAVVIHACRPCGFFEEPDFRHYSHRGVGTREGWGQAMRLMTIATQQ